jgi:hypothetical protein
MSTTVAQKHLQQQASFRCEGLGFTNTLGGGGSEKINTKQIQHKKSKHSICENVLIMPSKVIF